MQPMFVCVCVCFPIYLSQSLVQSAGLQLELYGSRFLGIPLSSSKCFPFSAAIVWGSGGSFVVGGCYFVAR